MDNKKNFTVRFDLDKPGEKSLYEWLDNVTRENRISKNCYIHMLLGNARDAGAQIAQLHQHSQAERGREDGESASDIPEIPDEAMNFMDDLNG